jgi:hypothetical protein
VSPEEIRENDLAALARRTIEALSVNGDGDTAHIMACAIAQANLELGVVAHMLEPYQLTDEKLGDLFYFVMGIRDRLSLAAHGAETLADLLKKKAEVTQ